MDKIRLLLVEHNAPLTCQIRQICREAGLAVVGEATCAAHAFALIPQIAPDVILMDVLLPDMGVLEAIPLALAHAPAAKVILLADDDETRYQSATERIGACACLRKDLIATELAQLVNVVAGTETRQVSKT